MAHFSWTSAGDFLGPNGLVAGAALGEQEPDNFLKRVSVRGAAKKRAFAPHCYEAFGFQLVEVMRECGRRDSKLGADLTDDKPFGMRGEQKPHDSQARLCSKRSEHVGVARDLIIGTFEHGTSSMVL
jgi:hypothetical protein